MSEICSQMSSLNCSDIFWENELRLKCHCSESYYNDFMSNCCYNNPTICYQGQQIWHCPNTSYGACYPACQDNGGYYDTIVKYRGSCVSNLRFNNTTDLLHCGVIKCCSINSSDLSNAAALNFSFTDPNSFGCICICEGTFCTNAPLSAIYRYMESCNCNPFDTGTDALYFMYTLNPVCSYGSCYTNGYYTITCVSYMQMLRPVGFASCSCNRYASPWSNYECVSNSWQAYDCSFVRIDMSPLNKFISLLSVTIPLAACPNSNGTVYIPNICCFGSCYPKWIGVYTIQVPEECTSTAASALSNCLNSVYSNLETSGETAYLFNPRFIFDVMCGISSDSNARRSLSPIFMNKRCGAIDDMTYGCCNFKAPANYCQCFFVRTPDTVTGYYYESCPLIPLNPECVSSCYYAYLTNCVQHVIWPFASVAYLHDCNDGSGYINFSNFAQYHKYMWPSDYNINQNCLPIKNSNVGFTCTFGVYSDVNNFDFLDDSCLVYVWQSGFCGWACSSCNDNKFNRQLSATGVANAFSICRFASSYIRSLYQAVEFKDLRVLSVSCRNSCSEQYRFYLCY